MTRCRHLDLPDGTRLAVVEVGAAGAPAWVLAHGVGSSARFVTEAFAAPLLAAGRRLIAYDLRGHGASSAAVAVEHHHLDVHAGDLAAVVHGAVGAVGDVEVVGGLSLGAHAAVRAAGRGLGVPVVLAALPAWSGTGVRGAGPHAAIAAEVREVGIDGVLARLRADTAMPAWLRTTLLTDYPRHDPASLTAALLALDGGEAPDERELRALDPALALLAWDADPGHPLAVARDWQAWAARSSLVTVSLPGLGQRLTMLGDAALEAVRAVTGPSR